MSQYTNSGLSKPFSCCGHWDICDMGKKEEFCLYREKDPETMLNCRSYQRNHQKDKTENSLLEEAFAIFELYGGRENEQ
jgi:hypothetical protein